MDPNLGDGGDKQELCDWSDTYEMTNSILAVPLISARTLILGMGETHRNFVIGG